jgi:hypothetical protein
MDLNSWYLFIEYGLVLFIVLGFALLFAIGLVVRDFEVIKKRPVIFILETLLISVLPAVPILFFVVSRGITMEVALTWLYGMCIKFAILHILFQISGFYTFLFS